MAMQIDPAPPQPKPSPDALAIYGLLSVIGLGLAAIVSNVGGAVLKLLSANRESKSKDCQGQLEYALRKISDMEVIIKSLEATITRLENEVERWRDLTTRARAQAHRRPQSPDHQQDTPRGVGPSRKRGEAKS